MFLNCTSLTNLNIKHFDISSVTNGTDFLQNANNALTTTQYDELLEAWAAQDVQPNVPWHFGDAQYTVVNIADWYSPRGASSLSIINNKLVSIADGTNTFGAAQQVDNLVVGSVYKIAGKATCSNSSAQVYIRVSPISYIDSSFFSTNATGSVTANDTFIATATTLYVGTLVSGHVANDTVTIDAGITVKEITNYTEANAASEIEYSQENVFGGELVVNGDFANGSSGWTGLEVVNGYARVNSAAAGSQSLTLTNGKTYRLTLDINAKGVTPSFKITNSTMSTVAAYGGDVFKTYSVFFTVGSTGLSNISLNNGSQTALWDNVSVKEITNAVTYQNIAQDVRDTYTLIDDTWVGSNELVVNGDFSNSFTSWNRTTYNPAKLIVNGEAILTVSEDGGAGNIARISQGISTQTGGMYRISGILRNINSSDQFALKASATINLDGSFFTSAINFSTIPTFITGNFTALSEITYVGPASLGGSEGDRYGVSNVSVKEIIEVAS